jgi:hypothetical protein
MDEYPGRCDPDYQANHDGNRYPFHVAVTLTAAVTAPARWKLWLASYFVRINFDYGHYLSAFFLAAFRMVGTNPSFNVTTSDKWHVKHGTVIRWRANV